MDLTSVRGDTITLDITVRDGVTRAVVDISAATFAMTVKYNLSTPDVGAVCQATDINIVDGPNGRLRIILEPAKTTGVVIGNLGYVNLFYDVQMTRAGEVSTILRGILKLFADVTLG